jgi:lysophospholipase L1-like esterase
VLAPALLLIARFVVARVSVKDGRNLCGLLGHAVGRRAVLCLGSLYLTVGLLESVLAVTDFKLDMPPVIFSLADEAGTIQQQKGYADPELRWRFRKGERYHGTVINSLGYRDREVEPRKPEGGMRVICMGDSCTAQGKPPYSGRLHALLESDPPSDHAWEAFNMAVYGYSSIQGLRVFQKEARLLSPDVVTVYFGWNDHWIEPQTDRARMAVALPRWQALLYERLRSKRAFMLLAHLAGRGEHLAVGRNAGPVFRVPPEEYRDVLVEFVEAIRDVGAHPILMTAPRGKTDLNINHVRFPDRDVDLNQVHDEYVEITRAVAEAHDVVLLDLHRLWKDKRDGPLFTSDGIHLTDAGLQRVAELLKQELDDLVAGGLVGGSAARQARDGVGEVFTSRLVRDERRTANDSKVD